MAKDSIRDTIARAIKDADKRWFNEDYGQQADAVMRALKENDLAIVPRQASDDMADAGMDAISFGRRRPEDLVREVFRAMVDAVSLYRPLK